MYYPNDIEEVCYDMEHINQVTGEIRNKIPEYFKMYLDAEGGFAVTDDEISKLAKAFRASSQPKPKPKKLQEDFRKHTTAGHTRV